jgi:hypothetical protein
MVRRPAPESAALALVLPSVLALLATTCSAAPPAASPEPSAPPPATSDPSRSNWTVPGVPLIEHRSVILLQPRQGAPDAAAISAIAPYPPPLVEQRQWLYDLRYDKGEIYLLAVHGQELQAPRKTPRAMGRFALELYTGPTLLERVRFDFPGLGAGEPMREDGGRQPLHGGPLSFTAKLTTRIGVLLPATTRGTSLVLWDRATNLRRPLPWPAVEMTSEPAAPPDAAILGE